MDVASPDASALMVEARGDAMRQVERDVVQVASLFQSMALLVEQQGGHLENIESNLELAAAHVCAGQRELCRLSRAKTRRRRRRLGLLCACAACGLTFLACAMFAVRSAR